MPAATEHKNAAMRLIREALLHIPSTRPNDLPPSRLIPDVPEWHGFEHKLWKLGEDVRQVINQKPTLRSDRELYSSILAIAKSRAGMRGRQSWIQLFAYKPCNSWGREIAALLPDSDIDGHVISALYKMKSSGFSEQIVAFEESKTAWIRKAALQYVDFDHRVHSNPNRLGLNQRGQL